MAKCTDINLPILIAHQVLLYQVLRAPNLALGPPVACSGSCALMSETDVKLTLVPKQTSPPTRITPQGFSRTFLEHLGCFHHAVYNLH